MRKSIIFCLLVSTNHLVMYAKIIKTSTRMATGNTITYSKINDEGQSEMRCSKSPTRALPMCQQSEYGQNYFQDTKGYFNQLEKEYNEQEIKRLKK